MKRILALLTVLVCIAGSYLFVSYTDWGPVARYRDLYIETAMGTMTHQWLARIFPQDVIERTMAGVEARFEDNKTASSPVPDTGVGAALISENPAGTEEAVLSNFKALFPDVDPEDLKAAGLIGSYQELAGLDVQDLSGVYTMQGDEVWAINVPEGILIVTVRSKTYSGKLAIAGSPERTVLAKNSRKDRGSTVTELCGDYDAILGVNASGFYDPNGHGKGDVPVGLVISGGERSGEAKSERYQTAGMDYENRFRMGYGLDLGEMRDAVQFYPICVMEGRNMTDGSFGMGIQPRTLVGQRADGAMMFLVVDGRQPGHSLGIDISTCSDILIKYGCYSAMNMDGGSSSSMTYKGEMVTRTSSPMESGRYLPDAWVVRRTVREIPVLSDGSANAAA